MRDGRDGAAGSWPSPSGDDPDTARWTEQWLWSGAGGGSRLDQRPVGYRARDRAEVAIVRTPHLPPQGLVRAQIQARRAAALARLSEVDERLRTDFDQRRLLVDRIERCSLALRGLGHRFDARRGRYRGMRVATRQEDRDERLEMPPPEGDDRASASVSAPPNDEQLAVGLRLAACELTGAALRGRAEEILRLVEVAVTPAELIELLGLDGVTVAGRPSQTLTNALRVSIARGDVERIARGRYRWNGAAAAA